MIYRKLDENGDYTFGSNGNCYLSGAEAVRQAVVTRLRLLLYEWWEDLEDGLPLWQKILAQRDRTQAEKAIRDRIASTQYVTAIKTFDCQWNTGTRSLSIAAAIDTEYGPAQVNEVM